MAAPETPRFFERNGLSEEALVDHWVLTQVDFQGAFATNRFGYTDELEALKMMASNSSVLFYVYRNCTHVAN